ncbi:MAG: hypothetical protein N7Q72_03335 [Spiroplasma sp. Tabriz.8]|nr:hypothetical protein [Candidatus Karelsulcia muelleri]MCZ8632276.1 hypothetical protein [Spiroplasma sp. Tabriz.8]
MCKLLNIIYKKNQCELLIYIYIYIYIYIFEFEMFLMYFKFYYYILNKKNNLFQLLSF